MKRALLALSMMFALPVFSNNDTSTIIEKREVTEHAHDLNLLLQEEFKHIDALIDILQYIGQAINKGAISVENKRVVHAWIASHTKAIRSIESLLENLGKRDETPLDENRLSFYAQIIQMFSYHLQHAIENKLEILNSFTLHTTPFKAGKIHTLEQTTESIRKNKQLIESVRLDANNLGLTTVNLLARELDAMNNDFKIIERGKMLLATVGFATAITYLMPESFLVRRPEGATGPINDNDTLRFPQWIVNPILKAKSWLGERPEVDKDKKLLNESRLGIIGQAEAFYNDKDTKGILATLAITGGWMFGQKIDRASRDMSRNFRRWWSQIKGFTVEADKSHYKVYDDLTLDDERLVGLESQKEILRDIAHYVLDPEVFDRTNANPAKSILLTGPSGSGKTLLARALSGTINEQMKARGKKNKFGFKEVKWSEIVGWGDDGLKMVIEEAKDNAPCVLFIDELHNLPLQTQAHGGNKVLSEFLTAMSGLNSEGDANHQVILLAATNKQELLDPALLRSGRFGDIIIRCEKPNLEQRKRYFNIMFAQNSVDASNIDIDDLAEQTEGSTFSDLDGILREANFKARTLAQRVKQGHIQKKIDSHVHRINKNAALTKSERKIIAAHVAGTVLMHTLPETKTASTFKLATTYGIWPGVVERRVWNNPDPTRDGHDAKTKYGKVFTYNSHENSALEGLEDLLKSAKIKLAGKLSEKILLGTAGSTYKKDARKKAFTLIRKYHLDGFDEKELPKGEREQLNSESLAMLKNFELEVNEILLSHKEIIEKIAQLLEENITVSDKEVAAIMQSTTVH